MTKTSETQSQTEQPKSTTPSGRSSLALAVFAVGLNATAAVYALSPSDFALPNVGILAELLPHQRASDPIPDPVIAALKDIRSVQQRQFASLQGNNSSLQQNTALLQQDSTTLASLRQSIMDEQVDVKKISDLITDEQVDLKRMSAQITDEHVDVKKISTQISTLIAKVDSLQNAITPEVTSSISTEHARNRPSGVVRKRMARHAKPVGSVSVGGARPGFPAITPIPQG